MINTSIGILSESYFIQKSNEGSIPENLIVTGDLYLNNSTTLTKLPKGLQVKGNLHLTGCTSLKTLPKGLQVKGWLLLSGCTSLTALPSDIKVRVYLSVDKSFLQNYPFKEIPKILHLPFDEDLKNVLLERLQ